MDSEKSAESWHSHNKGGLLTARYFNEAIPSPSLTHWEKPMFTMAK